MRTVRHSAGQEGEGPGHHSRVLRGPEMFKQENVSETPMSGCLGGSGPQVSGS
jgi:hypothetical protein